MLEFRDMVDAIVAISISYSIIVLLAASPGSED